MQIATNNSPCAQRKSSMLFKPPCGLLSSLGRWAGPVRNPICISGDTELLGSEEGGADGAPGADRRTTDFTVDSVTRL